MQEINSPSLGKEIKGPANREKARKISRYSYKSERNERAKARFSSTETHSCEIFRILRIIPQQESPLVHDTNFEKSIVLGTNRETVIHKIRTLARKERMKIFFRFKKKKMGNKIKNRDRFERFTIITQHLFNQMHQINQISSTTSKVRRGEDKESEQLIIN